MKNILSLVITLLLFSVGSASGSTTITGAEYYFDSDPGEGNGQALNVDVKNCYFGISCASINQQVALPNSLVVGYHWLYIRMKNQVNIWGIAQKHLIKVTGEKYVAAAEYFFDTDPGAGNGLPLMVENGGWKLAEINTSSLVAGPHQVFVRMKDSENNWGPARQHTIEISFPKTITTQGAEYFIGSDPGLGQGTALAFEGGVYTSALKTTGMKLGTDTLSVRLMDSESRWGPTQQVQFIVHDPAAQTAIWGNVSAALAGWANLNVVNATITLGGTSYSTLTNANGDFTLYVPPETTGEYDIIVSATGLGTISETIHLDGKPTIKVDLPSMPDETNIYKQQDMDKAIADERNKYDLNGDGKFGLEEAIQALRFVTGKKE